MKVLHKVKHILLTLMKIFNILRNRDIKHFRDIPVSNAHYDCTNNKYWKIIKGKMMNGSMYLYIPSCIIH